MAPDIQGSYFLSISIDMFADFVLGRVGATIARVYD